MELIQCVKGHKRTEGDECPVCKYGKPTSSRPPTKIAKFATQSYVGIKKTSRPGKTKPILKHECPKCGLIDFVIRNPKGNSANCFSCGYRIY